MKKIILTFVTLFCAGTLFAQNSGFSGYSSGNNPHDSLLFDGENFSSYHPDECKITVDYAVGTVDGAVYETKVVKVCGIKEKDKIVVNRDLKLNDELAFGQTIETKSYSSLWIQLPDGSKIKIGPNSKFVIPKNLCEGQSTNWFKLLTGKIWYGMKWAVTGGKYKFEVETERASFSHRGTEYSIEVKDNEDILRVYEGSVEIKPQKFLYSDVMEEGKSKEEQIKKLYEDYQSGKISMDEFIKKQQEITKKFESESKEMKTNVVVEAGYQCAVGEKFGDVVPIENDDRLWEDPNFNK